MGMEHSNDSTGDYFNFLVDDVNAILGRKDWTNQSFLVKYSEN